MYVRYCQNKPKSDYLVSQDDFEQVWKSKRKNNMQKNGRNSTILAMADGEYGRVPSYFLELSEIPGGTLAEQIREYRRLWYSTVDNIDLEINGFPLSKTEGSEEGKIHEIDLNKFSDGSPMFVAPLSDVIVREGDPVVLQPFLTSSSSLTGTWRGPAIEAGRAKIESDGTTTRLIISSCCQQDSGPYSLVAENSCGLSSTVARVNVVSRPGIFDLFAYFGF
uniref:IG domain-containing protein n=1 Tax=Heterorhabditis bacteriophora TaxID=37862 RepID=A0A1I7WT49_HETBA